MSELPNDEVQPDAPQQPESQDDARIPYERFKAVNDELNSLKSKMSSIESSQAEADQRAKEEQGKWEELYKQAQDQLEQEQIERLRLQIAGEMGIASDAVNRIQGSTEEEMRADAKTLIELLKPATGPGVPAPKKASQPADLDISQMSPEEIRTNRVKLLKQATVS